MSYKEERKDYLYYKIIREILSIIQQGNNSIIDVGSNGVDLLSPLRLKDKVSVDLVEPVVADDIKSYKIDFFDYKPDQYFDIVTCFQVIEHVQEAQSFTKKLQETGKILLISLPFKWNNGTCQYHCQDPVDEKKIFSWTNKKPDYVWICEDKDYLKRIICLYCKDKKYKKALRQIKKYQEVHRRKPGLIKKFSTMLKVLING